MATQFLTFDEVLKQLQIDEEELKRLVSEGELRGFRDGDSMKFKHDDVMKVKKGRETEPTIILTDSDQALGVEEASDELILDDSGQEESVLNIDDIVDEEDDEISLEEPEDDVVPTVEVPTLEDEEGVTFELDEDDEEDLDEVAPKSGTGSRISRSSRLRAMQIQERASSLPWTLTLVVTSVFMVLPMAIYTNLLKEVAPVWILDVTDFFKGIGESIGSMFL